MKVTIKGKDYQLNTPINEVSYLQIAKYMRCHAVDSNYPLTAEIDKSASYHFSLVIDKAPFDVFTEQGIRGLSLMELVSIFTSIRDAIPDEKNDDIIEVESKPSLNKEEEVKQLEERLAKLREG